MRTLDEQVRHDSAWARAEMLRLGEGRDTDTEGWHSMADELLLECLGRLIDVETADEIRAWFERGEKWYA